MKTSELKLIIEAAEQLGFNDIAVVIADGRDGVESYPQAGARLEMLGTQHDQYAALIITSLPQVKIDL